MCRRDPRRRAFAVTLDQPSYGTAPVGILRSCLLCSPNEGWRRGELNPRPEAVNFGVYVRSRVFCSRRRGSHGQDTRRPARVFSSTAPERSPSLIPICVA
ncbi:MAG: hypothetical protein H6Q33_3996 [Deltaproteobacteria bacterium]|nr:hypothetical protein [Deltaproteobacteria bacterium]